MCVSTFARTVTVDFFDMTSTSAPLDRNDYGKFIIRAMVAGLILFHGIGKLLDPSGTVGWLGSALTAMHLPAFFAYGVYLGEVVGPIMVLAGLYSRIGGVLIAVNMLFALAIAHAGEIFALTASGTWAIEHQMFYLLSAIAVAVYGSGRIAVKPD